MQPHNIYLVFTMSPFCFLGSVLTTCDPRDGHRSRIICRTPSPCIYEGNEPIGVLVHNVSRPPLNATASYGALIMFPYPTLPLLDKIRNPFSRLPKLNITNCNTF